MKQKQKWSRSTYEMVSTVLWASDLCATDLAAVSERFETVFSDDNPRFDSTKFRKACGRPIGFWSDTYGGQHEYT